MALGLDCIQLLFLAASCLALLADEWTWELCCLPGLFPPVFWPLLTWLQWDGSPFGFALDKEQSVVSQEREEGVPMFVFRHTTMNS